MVLLEHSLVLLVGHGHLLNMQQQEAGAVTVSFF